MIESIFKEGAKAWNDGTGFVFNPFNISDDEENYLSWSSGWWSIQNQMEMVDRKILEDEYQKELALDASKKEMIEKKKSKMGRAELAGQDTLF